MLHQLTIISFDGGILAPVGISSRLHLFLSSSPLQLTFVELFCKEKISDLYEEVIDPLKYLKIMIEL